MESTKKHKRSGSYSAKAVPAPLPRLKKSLSGKSFGKYQASGRAKPEKKNIDKDIGAAITTCPTLTTATPVLLNTYTAGTGGTNTLGRRVVNTSLCLRMTIAQPTISGVGTAGPTAVRVVVVYDKEANGAAPATTDVFQTAIVANASSMMNLNNSHRFTIIMDEKFCFGQLVITGAPASAASAPTCYQLDRYVKFKLESIANATFNGAITNIFTGSFYLFAFSDTVAASNPPQVVSGMSRIRFIDG